MSKQVILIVEDEPDIREGIRILLEGEGFHILEAESGEQALRSMNDAVDLVILDIMLPGMSGLKVCEELRQYSTVPILFLTAKSQESDKTIGLTAGADDYLSKPFSYAELIARVKALLRRYCVYRGKKQTVESNGIGIESVQAMMEEMNGSCRVEQTESGFQITLLFRKQ